MPAETAARVGEAVRFAIAWHGDQRRPTGAPYLDHLLEALEVLVRGAGVTDADVLCAAVLHDVVEDTPCTLEQVSAAFGPQVAELVGWVTIPEPGPGAEQVRGQAGLPATAAGRSAAGAPGQAGRPGQQRADAAQPGPGPAAVLLRADRHLHRPAGRDGPVVRPVVRGVAAGLRRPSLRRARPARAAAAALRPAWATSSHSTIAAG